MRSDPARRGELAVSATHFLTACRKSHDSGMSLSKLVVSEMFYGGKISQTGLVVIQ